MEMFAEQIVETYLRTCLSLFSVKDFQKGLQKIGIPTDENECQLFLETHSSVFALDNEMYITRAGVFTGRPFSFKPTKRELADGVFIPGHRFMPFIDPELLSANLKFFYNGKQLPHKVVEYDNVTAESFFSLMGEEFSPQFILSDPANEGMSIIDNESVLPPTVQLTAVDISKIINDSDFKYGDRILCCVSDWDDGKIELRPLVRTASENGIQMQAEDMKRLQWNSILEDAMLDSFDRAGPCSSIEEQLALVFLENVPELCVEECGSIEECLMQSDKVALEQYGIETRIWKRGEDVPAIGAWNNFSQSLDGEVLYNDADVFMTDFLIDAFIKNQIAQKKLDTKKIIEKILPDDFPLTEKDAQKIYEKIYARQKVVQKKYNSFADFAISDVRRQALELYEKVVSLIFKIDSARAELEEYPQQELVTVSQIYSHLLHIIEHLEFMPEDCIDEREELLLSIDGMNYNYDGIYEKLERVIAKSMKNSFMLSR